MIKKRYIKRAYVEEVYCDKCGAEMRHTGMILTCYPALYPFECINPNCSEELILQEDKLPGILRYEFEEEENNV